MKFIALLILSAGLLSFSACSPGSKSNQASGIATKESSAPVVTVAEQNARTTDSLSNFATTPVSLKEADAANTAAQAVTRKIIRNGNLTLEVASPGDTQPKIVSIAESHQGFVVTSEATQRTADDKTKPEITVNLIVRVPASQFNQVMEEIRAVGTRKIQEKVTGQDVTEEFMDLEARIKNQKALELQFLEIMKRAGKVDDALSVQTQLAQVRTEIEKLEGRKNFLANRSSLSTITVNIQTPTPIVVSATGFGRTVRDAVSDSLDLASGIVLFLVRFVIVTIPVFVFVILPLGLIALYFKRRAHRVRLAHALEVNPASD
jgi:hypothetical protein